MPQARTRSGRLQQAAADSQSAVLQCLEKLNEDTFCQILLPKLKADGSAGSLAATCSQLRRLYHNSIKRLDMSPLLRNCAPRAAEQWARGLQEHFPNCSSVQLYVEHKESYQAAHYVLPALARLPSLAGLTVEVKGPPLSDMLPMAMLLLSLRTQLTSLQSLWLQLSQSWAQAGMAWIELASMTQLTRLSIISTHTVQEHRPSREASISFHMLATVCLHMQGNGACEKTDLLQLSQLRRLKHLHLEFGGSNLEGYPVCFDLVPQLTALTALELKMCTAYGFRSIRNCTNLQALILLEPDGLATLELSAADWEVVGQLTRLTQLALWPVVQRTGCAACRSALQRLTALQELYADAWAPQVLPGLQGLSHLTAIGGGWLPGVVSAEPATCPQVEMLTYSYGDIPCSAFPNLLHVSAYKSITSRALAALGRRCCLLESFRATDFPALRHTLDLEDPSAERVAALMSLSNLHHLTALSFCARDNPEILALFRVAAVLARHKLHELQVVVHSQSEVTSSGLVTLAHVSGLPVLKVPLLKPTLMRTADVSQVFVSVLVGIERVRLVVAREEQQANLNNAFERIRSCGLPVPQDHEVSVKSP